GKIDVAHAVEPFERHHDLVPGFEWNLPADEAGIAALRYNGSARRVGLFEDRGNFLGLAWLEHQRRLPAVAVAPLHEVRRHCRGIADRIVLAHDADEGVESCLRRGLMDLLARHSE